MIPAHKFRMGGYALLTSLIFLVVLTLVAVTAIRGSGLELRMSANNLAATEAFESSEAPRRMVSDIVDAHVFNRGWPAASGGSVPDVEFDYTIPSGLTLVQQGGAPRTWYDGNTEAGPLPINATALTEDASYSRDLSGSGQQKLQLNGNVSVFKLRTDLSPGAGAAMVSGYEGTGKSAAASGGRIFFYVQSTGRDLQVSDDATSTQNASAVTATDYRYVIRN